MSGFGIVCSDDDRSWKELRKLVHNYLRNVRQNDLSFVSLVTSQAERLVRKISELDGSYFDPTDNINVTIANVTTSIVMGKTYEYADQEFIHVTKLIRDAFEYAAVGAINYHVPILTALPTEVSKKGEKSFKNLFEFIDRDIRRYRESHDLDDEDKPTNLLEAFLKEQRTHQTKVGKEFHFLFSNNKYNRILYT